MIRKRKKQKKQIKTLKREAAESKIKAENKPRVVKTEEEAYSTSFEKLKDIGRERGAASPKELREAVQLAFRDGRITGQELAEILMLMVLLFEVDQEHTATEASYLAAKAKEARVVGEEVGDELLNAGLVSSDDFMTDLGRGSIFFPNGRRLDVGSLMGALALAKSSVTIPKLPGTTTLQDRLFSARPESVLRHIGDDETCFVARVYTYTAGEDEVEVQAMACTELFDPDKHTHITGLVNKSVTSLGTVDRAIFGLPSTVPSNAVAGVNEAGAGYCLKTFEILKLWPTLKKGDRIPLQWNDSDADLEAGDFGSLVHEATGFIAPLYNFGTAGTVTLFHAAKVTTAIDMAALGSIAAMIGITHLTDKPWMQAAGLLQGSLESLLNRAGTVDYSTAAREV